MNFSRLSERTNAFHRSYSAFFQQTDGLQEADVSLGEFGGEPELNMSEYGIIIHLMDTKHED